MKIHTHPMLFREEEGAGGGASTLFAADGSFAEKWTDHLPADFIPTEEREAFQTHVSKYKNPLDVIKSDFHKERLLGKRGVSVPGEGAKPEEIAAYRKAIGVPDDAKGYVLKPEKLPEGVTWDDAAVAKLAELAHKHNVPAAAMKDFVAMQLETEAGRTKAFELEMAEHAKTNEKTLRTEFGGDFDAKMKLANRMAATLGLPKESWGAQDPDVVRALVKAASFISEDKLINSDLSVTAKTGNAEGIDIIKNPENPHHKKYWSGDNETVDRVRKLLQAA